jgi:nucleoside-diphosphate-sugar epimerase
MGKKKNYMGVRKVRILITGGTGFIGSNLCQKLSADNEVFCIDNNITGNPDNIKNLNVEFIEHDVTKPIDIQCNRIYHLASPASPVAYQNLGVETMLANSIGTLNMLKLAQKNQARLLFASTSEVYGDPKQHPQSENYWGNVNPIGPRSMYDESKRFGEALIMCYPYQEKRIARIFNTYGPFMKKDDGRVITNFINQALTNTPITVYGSGKQTRSCCYIDDMIDGLITVMESDYTKPVNIGNPEEVTILELAKKIKQMTNSNSEISFAPLPQDDPVRRKPDITVAKTLGWEPKIPLNEGLQKTITYFQNLYRQFQ